MFRADSEESVITPVMTKLARDKTFPSVFLCWMPVWVELLGIFHETTCLFFVLKYDVSKFSFPLFLQLFQQRCERWDLEILHWKRGFSSRIGPGKPLQGWFNPIMVLLCSPTLEVLLVQIAMSSSLSSKDWFKRYNFAACDKLTTSPRHGLFHANQTCNQLATVVFDPKNVIRVWFTFK